MDPQQQKPPDPSTDPPFIDITPEPAGGGRSYGSGQYSQLDRMLRRRRNVFFGALLLLTAATAFWLSIQPHRYEATSTVLVSRIGPDASAVTETELASEVELVWAQTAMLSDLIRGAAAVGESAQTTERRREELRSHVAAKQQAGSQVIAISFLDSAAQTAVEQCNRLTDLYLQHRRSLFAYPNHLVVLEAESAVLNVQADQAAKELAEFEIQAKGNASPELFRIKSQRLANLEDRILELRASLKGQEEVVRVLRARNAEILQAEAQLAGMRAKLQEMQREYSRWEVQETQAGTMAAKREELARRASLSRDRAEFLARRLRDSQVAGMNLQASRLTRAEAIPVRTFHLVWWQLLLLGLGILAIASVCAWAVEIFDRPVYSDDEFARMTGAPKVRPSAG